jgi:hypothetical protein
MRLHRRIAVNICHDGGSVIAFRDAWHSRDSRAPRPPGADWIEYCQTRERKERACAQRAASVEARRIHQELAQSYAHLIGEASDA